MIDYHPFYDLLTDLSLSDRINLLSAQIDGALNLQKNQDLKEWLDILSRLPALKPSAIDFRKAVVTIGSEEDCSPEQRKIIETLLHELQPWRKGPFDLFGIYIDSEWRSDWKWDRLREHIEPLDNRLVLDVGCGNGYYGWRMLGEGARAVIGIDPYLKNVMQYWAIRHFTGPHSFYVLPLAVQDMPNHLQLFDSVFSMGVLYHRRLPIEHLVQLHSFLRSEGQLVLETLVIDGPGGKVLQPKNRYAKMRNVWFIPSLPTLEQWLEEAGFVNVQRIDITRTTPLEQRRTPWMPFESLSDFLDKENPLRTVEGYPAPLRAIFTAKKPPA